MDILNFDQFRTQLILEQEDPAAAAAGAPPPPPSPATDVPPPPPTGGGAPPPPPPPPPGPSPIPDDPNAAPPAPAGPEPLKFVFIQDASQKKWYGVHDKDGGTKRFTVYEVQPDELEKWLVAHKDDEDSELVKAALQGKRPMPSTVYSDFKREVTDGKLGSDKGPIDIKFDSETDFDNPATEDLSVVFLKSGK